MVSQEAAVQVRLSPGAIPAGGFTTKKPTLDLARHVDRPLPEFRIGISTHVIAAGLFILMVWLRGGTDRIGRPISFASSCKKFAGVTSVCQGAGVLISIFAYGG